MPPTGSSWQPGTASEGQHHFEQKFTGLNVLDLYRKQLEYEWGLLLKERQELMDYKIREVKREQERQAEGDDDSDVYYPGKDRVEEE